MAHSLRVHSREGMTAREVLALDSRSVKWLVPSQPVSGSREVNAGTVLIVLSHPRDAVTYSVKSLSWSLCTLSAVFLVKLTLKISCHTIHLQRAQGKEHRSLAHLCFDFQEAREVLFTI